MKKVLIVGATSAIAEAVARLMADRGYLLHLTGRKSERLKVIASDLTHRGATSVSYTVFDAREMCESPFFLIDAAKQNMGGLDAIFLAHGTLPDQKKCIEHVDVALEEFRTNALSIIAVATEAANFFLKQGTGSIVVISSVAGDRGRQSNYVYGAAKGAVTIFLQGLRNRMHRANIQVLTVKPGFVDTPMTEDFKKGILWSSPEFVARGILLGMDKGKDEIYLPNFWRAIMFLIRHVPEWLFKRLSL